MGKFVRVLLLTGLIWMPGKAHAKVLRFYGEASLSPLSGILGRIDGQIRSGFYFFEYLGLEVQANGFGGGESEYSSRYVSQSSNLRLRTPALTRSNHLFRAYTSLGKARRRTSHYSAHKDQFSVRTEGHNVAAGFQIEKVKRKVVLFIEYGAFVPDASKGYSWESNTITDEEEISSQGKEDLHARTNYVIQFGIGFNLPIF